MSEQIIWHGSDDTRLGDTMIAADVAAFEAYVASEQATNLSDRRAHSTDQGAHDFTRMYRAELMRERMSAIIEIAARDDAIGKEARDSEQELLGILPEFLTEQMPSTTDVNGNRTHHLYQWLADSSEAGASEAQMLNTVQAVNYFYETFSHSEEFLGAVEQMKYAYEIKLRLLAAHGIIPEAQLDSIVAQIPTVAVHVLDPVSSGLMYGGFQREDSGDIYLKLNGFDLNHCFDHEMNHACLQASDASLPRPMFEAVTEDLTVQSNMLFVRGEAASPDELLHSGVYHNYRRAMHALANDGAEPFSVSLFYNEYVSPGEGGSLSPELSAALQASWGSDDILYLYDQQLAKVEGREPVIPESGPIVVSMIDW